MKEKQILGRFLDQENGSFPVDCETLDYLQNNIGIVSALGNILGDKAILQGCETDNTGKSEEGYVFLKTTAFPQGEVLFFEGGLVTRSVYVKEEAIKVTAQGYEFPQAYVVRSLVPGDVVADGQENVKDVFVWKEFKNFKTLFELEEKNAALDALIERLTPPPLGVVQIWAGKKDKIPGNYKLCDGSALNIADFPELYAVIGDTYRLGHMELRGIFYLPDLRGRFIVGYSPSDTDYNKWGNTGGEKTHRLTVEEMPSHSHMVRDYYYIEGEVYNPIGGAEDVGKNYSGSHDTDNDNHYLHYIEHNTYNKGESKAHENRPPYYTLAYIMRVK